MQKTELITPYSPESGDIRIIALTSEPFLDLIRFGLFRLNRYKAETNIFAISNGKEIIYPKPNLGGKHPSGIEEEMIGLEATVEAYPDMSKDWLEDHEYNEDKSYRTILTLHFHPMETGLSDQDLSSYDDGLTDLSGKYVFIPIRKDLFDGIFSPVWKNRHLPEAQRRVQQLNLFMFSGPPTSTEYQGVNFNNLFTLSSQSEVLQRCGFHVITAALPIQNSYIDFSELIRIPK